MRSFSLLLLFSGLLLVAQSGCAAWQQHKWLASHRNALKRLEASNLSAEQKLDGLVQNYVLLMQEGLRFVNPVKGAKYLQQYHDQNLGTIEKILHSTEKWQSGLNTMDALALGVRTAKKPYIGQLVDLVPKFKQKYKQYAFIVKLTGRITGGLTKFAGKALGL